MPRTELALFFCQFVSSSTLSRYSFSSSSRVTWALSVIRLDWPRSRSSSFSGSDSIWISDDPALVKLRRAATHLSHWAARTLGIGNGARSIRDGSARARQIQESLQEARRGFAPFEAEDYRVPAEHAVRHVVSMTSRYADAERYRAQIEASAGAD